MVCYLQPDYIVKPVKAAVGEEVLTPYGEGKVVAYRTTDDTYVIELKGWSGKLYAKAETFDRVGEGMPDGDGSFGVNWLLRFLFFSSSEKKAGARSRSNSITSIRSLKSGREV
jgi:hypothetical protein